ncbi:NAD(P)-dependent oxidoreductase [Streptomyces sp. NPDC005336]|uniref:NAD-dependent epimerase/dehydratase family protein n=1 Tax=Streptomyces sp. NPDC005336 TaxID=3157035 RepID=UPI0033A2E8E3
MRTEAELDEALTRPSQGLIESLSGLDGDLVVLGAGGKMGPSLVRLARRAIVEGGLATKVIAVSRFGSGDTAERLSADGVKVIRADLGDERDLDRLPEAANVVYMAGAKFGTTGNEHRTWHANSYLPGRIAERYRGARIAAFSTGNVYPLLPVHSGGATEATRTGPIGEYAMSCLGRERLLEHASVTFGTRVVLLRLNYAIDLRYGVLLDIARRVRDGEPIDVSMGCVNVCWQGWANEVALRALHLAAIPAVPLNVTGPETVSVRRIAEAFGARLGVEPLIVGEESGTALLTDATEAHRLFGYPTVALGQLIGWTAEWLLSGAPVWDKPTKFERRDGSF